LHLSARIREKTVKYSTKIAENHVFWGFKTKFSEYL
jgi:hypothetical protein